MAHQIVVTVQTRWDVMSSSVLGCYVAEVMTFVFILPIDICDGIFHCLQSADDEYLCNVLSCPPSCICRGTVMKCSNLVGISGIPHLITTLVLERYIVRNKTPFRHKVLLVHLNMKFTILIANTIYENPFRGAFNIITLVLVENNVHLCSILTKGSTRRKNKN